MQTKLALQWNVVSIGYDTCIQEILAKKTNVGNFSQVW